MKSVYHFCPVEGTIPTRKKGGMKSSEAQTSQDMAQALSVQFQPVLPVRPAHLVPAHELHPLRSPGLISASGLTGPVPLSATPSGVVCEQSALGSA